MQIFNQLVTAITKAREVLSQKIESFKAQQGKSVIGSWTDDTGTIFERRQDGSFTDLNGNVYVPSGTPMPYGGSGGGGSTTISGNIAKETGGHLQSIDASLAVPLPLPTNAAKETGGNLESIAASTLATKDNTDTIRLLLASSTPINTRPLTKATDSASVEVTNTTPIKVDASATTQPVSMADPAPLSLNAAKEAGGNLDAINTKLTDVSQDATLQSILALLGDGSQKTQVENFPAALDATAAALGKTSDAPFAAGAANGNVIELLKAVAAYLAGTLNVQLAQVPLATNAATETTQQSVLKALQKSSTSVWTDDAGLFYIQRQVTDPATGVMTLEYTDSYGNPVTPGAGLKPSSSSNSLSESQYQWVATNDGIGYLTGHILSQVTVIDVSTSPATMVMTAWVNLNTGQTLSATPPSSHLKSQDSTVTVKNSVLDVQAPNGLPLPTGAATEAGLQALLSNTAPIGGSGDAPWAGTGSATQIAILKALYGVLNFISSVQTDGTQRVMLPSNASQEAGGNLDQIKTAAQQNTQATSDVLLEVAKLVSVFGTKSDAAYTGTGDASAESLLKGIYALLAILESRTTANPALETGNLLKILTAGGTPSDVAWTGAGDGSQIAILKSLHATLNSGSKVFKGTPQTVTATTSSVVVQIPEGASRLLVTNDSTIDCLIKGASSTTDGVLQAGYAYAIDCPQSGVLESYRLTVPAGAKIWYLVQKS